MNTSTRTVLSAICLLAASSAEAQTRYYARQKLTIPTSAAISPPTTPEPPKTYAGTWSMTSLAAGECSAGKRIDTSVSVCRSKSQAVDPTKASCDPAKEPETVTRPAICVRVCEPMSPGYWQSEYTFYNGDIGVVEKASGADTAETMANARGLCESAPASSPPGVTVFSCIIEPFNKTLSLRSKHIDKPMTRASNDATFYSALCHDS